MGIPIDEMPFMLVDPGCQKAVSVVILANLPSIQKIVWDQKGTPTIHWETEQEYERNKSLLCKTMALILGSAVVPPGRFRVSFNHSSDHTVLSEESQGREGRLHS